MLFTSRGDLLRVFFGKTALFCHLRTADELEAIIDAENERVHRARRQFFVDEFEELVHAISGRRGDAEPANGQRLVHGLVRG